MCAATVRDVTKINQLLQVVRHVRAMVAAAKGQLAHRQLFIADVKEDQRLNVVDVANTRAVELRFDHFETATVKALNGGDRI